jgi:hypothetical protein
MAYIIGVVHPAVPAFYGILSLILGRMPLMTVWRVPGLWKLLSSPSRTQLADRP